MRYYVITLLRKLGAHSIFFKIERNKKAKMTLFYMTSKVTRAVDKARTTMWPEWCPFVKECGV